MASADGELLACQPYGGSSTHIKDYGLGQGPNVVLGLTDQYVLLPGSKVYVDNLFTSMDLLDHMGDRQLGVTGTVRQNRLHGVPLLSKKEASKELQRGDHRVIYTQDKTIVLWQDSQAVYMASNVDDVEPLGTCQRYSKKEKKYGPVSQPYLNEQYNKNMGGVDLFDNSGKNYAITTRVKKWYWCLYTWFLNACMVQAWRLFRAHHKELHRLKLAVEVEEDARFEEEIMQETFLKATVDEKRRERRQMKRRSRAEEKKLEEIGLLEFTRQAVDLIFKKHMDKEREASFVAGNTMLTSSTLAEVKFDNGRHLVIGTKIRGVCKECHNRTTYRCLRCNVALHPDKCFLLFHTPEGDRVDLQES